MIKITIRNIVYFVIIVLLIVITAWYLSASCEGYDNLDDVLSGVSSCTDPNGCKTIDEIKKESEGDLSKQTAELAKPVVFPSNKKTKSFLITLNNKDKSKPIVILTPPPSVKNIQDPISPKLIDSSTESQPVTGETSTESQPVTGETSTESQPVTGETSTESQPVTGETSTETQPVTDKTSNLSPDIKPKLNLIRLNASKSDVDMLDVDPEEKGINTELYNISSISLNYPDNEPLLSTFGEYKENSLLNDIYMERHAKYNKMRELSKLIPAISLNDKYSKGPKNQSVQLELDSGKLNNNFIIIAPKEADPLKDTDLKSDMLTDVPTEKIKPKFPSKFEIIITNNTELTGITLDLWGDYIFNQEKPHPIGNPNRILDDKVLTEYLNKKIDTFGYSKQAFGESCLVIEEKKCMVGGLDIGKHAINIIKSGDIYDNKDNIIGSVVKTDATMTDMNESFKIQINTSENITGVVLFLTYLQ